MNAPEPAPTAAAVPRKPRRKPPQQSKPPKAKRNPHAAIALVVRDDGSFVPYDEASRQICRQRKFFCGIKLIAYIYQTRSLEQWHKAHGLGCALVEHVEGFEALNAHSAIKKVQVDGNIACETETFDLGTFGKVTRSVAKSLAFDELDEGAFQEIYGQMLAYVREKYWPTLDEAGMRALQRLLGMGS